MSPNSAGGLALWGFGSQRAPSLAITFPSRSPGLLRRGQLGLLGQAGAPHPSLSTLPSRPPPQTLTWVWPGTTPGSAEPSLPSSEPEAPDWALVNGRGLRGGAGEQVRLVWAGGAARLGLGQRWGALSTSQDELFTSLRSPRCTRLPPRSHARSHADAPAGGGEQPSTDPRPPGNRRLLWALTQESFSKSPKSLALPSRTLEHAAGRAR